MKALHISSHAISRAIERLGCKTADEADRALRTKAVIAAAAFGAPYVRLAGGQRVVLDGHNVVTVLPAGCPHWRLSVARGA